MNIAGDGLINALKKGVAPIFVVSGDETLLVQEATDVVRRAADRAGYTSRVTETVAAGFDWKAWFGATQSRSIFADKQLLELRFNSVKLTAEASNTLSQYAQHINPDAVLLIVLPKLDEAGRNATWLRALGEKGVIVTIRPLTLAQLPAWTAARMRSRGLEPNTEAVNALCERTEGNPLACAQEIDKLLLLKGPGPVSSADIADLVADSARYDVFNLVDIALSGDSSRALRILLRLQEEAIDPVLILWALLREIRLLGQLQRHLAQGQAWAAACAAVRVWDSRKPLLQKAIKRLDKRQIKAMLAQALRTDRTIKGDQAGNPWDELIKLVLGICGAGPQTRLVANAS